MKYWLMPVNSAQRTSLRSLMTSSFPFIRTSRESILPRGARERRRSVARGGRDQREPEPSPRVRKKASRSETQAVQVRPHPVRWAISSKLWPWSRRRPISSKGSSAHSQRFIAGGWKKALSRVAIDGRILPEHGIQFQLHKLGRPRLPGLGPARYNRHMPEAIDV